MKKVISSFILALGLIFLSLGLYFEQMNDIRILLENGIMH